MDKLNYTPGPWESRLTMDGRSILCPQEDKRIAVVHDDHGMGMGEADANLALIKSAPDLYGACWELIHGGGTNESLQRAIDLARVALGHDKRP